MTLVVTGAGQIGQEVVAQAAAQGLRSVVIRRGAAAVARARTVRGDAGDRELLRRESRGASAILHCVHAAYDPASWRRELPAREQAVMDVAAELGIPVIFPESVYAFGHQAEDLREDAPIDPCTPLGEVRAELLAARAAHPARTLSMVAADLVGPTATTAGSVVTATVINPVRAGRTAWVFADPDLPHSLTQIPDLARAMILAAEYAADLAPTNDRILLAPSPPAISLRELAGLIADDAGRGKPSVRRVPSWPLAVAGLASPTMRSLHRQRYLWERPMVLGGGVLSGDPRFGPELRPTPLGRRRRQPAEAGAPVEAGTPVGAGAPTEASTSAVPASGW